MLTSPRAYVRTPLFWYPRRSNHPAPGREFLPSLQKINGNGYSGRVRKKTPRLVASILIVLMLNTLGWSVSTDAFADWLATEQTMEDVGPANNDMPDQEHPQQIDNHCNSGCHAPSHLQGLTQTPFAARLTSISFVIPHTAVFLSDNIPNHLYRPPRAFFLA